MDLITLYKETEKLYEQTDARLPWVDFIGDALNALQSAVSKMNTFDPYQHNLDISDQQMQDWRA